MSEIIPAESDVNPSTPEKNGLDIFEIGHASIAKNNPNEDSIVVNPEAGLFAIFDGAGGHKDGEVASSKGALAIQEVFENDSRQNLQTALQITSEQISNTTEGVCTAAIVKLVEKSKSGTEAMIEIAAIGDARVYVFDNEGKIRLVTIDNIPGRTPQAERQEALNNQKILSRISSPVELEELTGYQKAAFKDRHVISEYLGGNKKQDPLVYRIPIDSGSTVIITSDGVHDNLTDDEIYSLVNSGDKAQLIAEDIAKRSESRANQGGFRSKRDDTSVIVLKLQDSKIASLKEFLLDPTNENQSIAEQPPTNELQNLQIFKEGALPKNELVTYQVESMGLPAKLIVGYYQLEMSISQKEGEEPKLIIAVPGKTPGDYLAGKYMIQISPRDLEQRTLIGRNSETSEMLGTNLPSTISRAHLEIGFDGKNISFLDTSTNGTEIGKFNTQ